MYLPIAGNHGLANPYVFLWVGTLNRLLLFRSNFSHILIQETKEPAMQQCEAQTEQQNTSENLDQVFWESLVEVFLKKSLTRVFGGQFWTYWKVFWGGIWKVLKLSLVREVLFNVCVLEIFCMVGSGGFL